VPDGHRETAMLVNTHPTLVHSTCAISMSGRHERSSFRPRLPASVDDRKTIMRAATTGRRRRGREHSGAVDDELFAGDQAGGQAFPACLVLNADFSPLSYVPLSLWSWKDTVRAVFRGSAQVVTEYDDWVIRSPSLQLNLPSVIALKQYVPSSPHPPAFTRRNVYLRDGFTCQYCVQPSPTTSLTYDHVVPVSRQGPNDWTNVVTACSLCNAKKGSRLLKELGGEMKLKTPPYMPSRFELHQKARMFPPENLHADWKDYV